MAANDVCAGCHAEDHADWAESAHAQSLSHLHLATVNPDTRQPEQMTFGEVRGIGCRECHRVEKEPAAPLPKDATSLTACPFRFRLDPKPADSCRRCHGSTAAEWQAWLKGPQPRIATWPPGQIEMDRRGDTRTCVDCHMPPDPAAGDKPGRAHTWAARRDVQRLRDGLSATLTLTRGTAAPTLALINLSGHAYPTGTRRRALRILAGPSGDGAPATVADLSPVRPGRPLAAADCVSLGTRGTVALGDRGEMAAGPSTVAQGDRATPPPTPCAAALPALAPGERRAVPLSVPSGAPAVVCRLLYCRDVSDPQAYVVEIWQAEQDLRLWTGPAKLKTD
jgi:hypothetical protein